MIFDISQSAMLRKNIDYSDSTRKPSFCSEYPNVSAYCSVTLTDNLGNVLVFQIPLSSAVD